MGSPDVNEWYGSHVGRPSWTVELGGRFVRASVPTVSSHNFPTDRALHTLIGVPNKIRGIVNSMRLRVCRAGELLFDANTHWA